MAKLKIGVLGGIGPQATGLFYLKLIDKLQKEGLISCNEDFPQLLINSIPAQELIFEKIREDDLKEYIQGLEELDSLQPDFIMMVCNTIHLFHTTLQKRIPTPLLNLKEEVHKELQRRAVKKITILATPSTINLKLYEFDEFLYLNPNREELEMLTQSIFLFNKGINKEQQKRKMRRIAQKYLKLGSELILLGCTEFAVMLEGATFPTLNTLDILVNVVVEKCRSNKT